LKQLVFSGIDLIEIDRFNKISASILKRFFMRVFTPEEQSYIGKSHSRAAGIFAAKEAVAKALGCGIGPINWQDISISHTPERQPVVTLLNNAQKKASDLNIEHWSISITHTKNTAAAIAVAVASSEKHYS
jgi:holo-[acyl-carrier protein] synthase